MGVWQRAGYICGGLALGLPWLTWMLGRSPNYDEAINQTALLVFSTGMLLALGGLVAVREPWLGTFVGYMALRSLWTPTPWAFEAAQAITFVALGIVCLAALPRRWLRWLSGLLAVSGAFQVLIAVLQEQGYYPLWIGWQRIPSGWTHGTLGNPNHLGAFLALTVAFAPIWALPVWLLGLGLSRSVLAALAAVAAVAVRCKRLRSLDVLAFAAAVLLVFWMRGADLASWHDRVVISRIAVQAWSFAPIFGHGPGSWSTIGPSLQTVPEAASMFRRVGEAWGEVHNEPIQLLFEGGLLGAVLLGGWIWQRRRQLAIHPAVVALAVVSVGSFPFHVPTLMATAMAVLGSALAEPKEA